VHFFDATVAEVALLGEQHLRHLPMVYLDQRTTYQLSFDETSDKSEVYIVNRRCFAIAGGCALIFREGQDDIYGISQQWLLGDANLTDISIDDFPANQFSTAGRFSRVSFLDDMFFKYCQRESICAAFQQSLRSSKGIKKIMFTVGNIRPDTWEDILSYLDGVEIVKKAGTRTQDIASDEVVCKIAGAKELRSVHVDDPTLLEGFLGKGYSHYPICDASDLMTVNLRTCLYTRLECFNLFFDNNLCELRVANVGPVLESRQDQATLLLEQREIDVKFWKLRLENKWFFDVEAQIWIYVLLVDYVRKGLRRRKTRYDYAGVVVYCIEDKGKASKQMKTDPDYLTYAQQDPEEFATCFYDVRDFDVPSETIPFVVDKSIPPEQFEHWHAISSSSVLPQKRCHVENEQHTCSLEYFKNRIETKPYNDFTVSKWLVQHLEASFTTSTTKTDKRLLIRIELDYKTPSWNLANIFTDLKEGLGFIYSGSTDNKTCSSKKTPALLEKIAMELHDFLLFTSSQY
jgi:hypothetical protein